MAGEPTRTGVYEEGNNWAYFPDIDKKIYYHDHLLPNLQIMRRGVKHDRDCVMVIVGDPGSGKSVFAQQLAKYFDHNFTMDNIYFEGEKLIKAMVSPNTKKMTAFVYDEAREGLSARNSMSRQNKVITDCLAEIRQKNLFLIVVLPDYWDLDSNVANRRSRFLFHVFETPNPNSKEGEDPFNRGNFHFYNRKDKYRLYINGKKYHDMTAAPYSFHGNFLNQYVVDEDKYRRLKFDALRTNRNLEEEAKKIPPGAVSWGEVFYDMKKYYSDITYSEIGRIFKKDGDTVKYHYSNYIDKNFEPEKSEALKKDTML